MLTSEAKETSKNILGSIGCLSIIIIAIYALVSNRLIELIVIYLVFFGLLKLLDLTIISKLPEERQLKIKGFFNRNNVLTIILVFTLIFGTFFFGTRIIDGFTSVETLTERIHEDSKYKYSGSKCNDGWTSFSQGQGACSWHDGVKYKFYKGEYSKTLEECKLKAVELSWMD
jgi:hypothetical protein